MYSIRIAIFFYTAYHTEYFINDECGTYNYCTVVAACLVKETTTFFIEKITLSIITYYTL